MSKRLKIVADDKIPFLQGVMEPYAEITYLPGAEVKASDLTDADLLFTRTRTICDQALLDGSAVKLIATATIGYDHIDTDYCKRKGISWTNAPGCNAGSVNQYLASAIITLAQAKGWELSSKTIGIIGVGHVGEKVAATARLFGMCVLLNDPPREQLEGSSAFTSLATLLAESDIVTCHTPLTREGPFPTYHLASDDFFAQMKQGGVFINTSRGSVVDSEALRKAARHRLDEYILDVWEGEPTLDTELLRNAFLATPHIAGYSSDGKANGTAACIHAACQRFDINALAAWYPTTIPPPPMETTFAIEGKNRPSEAILFEALTHTYPIREDSNRLKQSPTLFEAQRGHYWTRREYPCFTLQLLQVAEAEGVRLEKLGFNIA